MKKFCYRCGALEDEKGPLIEGLCSECFLAENPPIKVPEKIELKICERCGAYFLKNTWRDIEKNPASEYLEASKEIATAEAEFLQRDSAGIRYVNFEDSKDVDISFKAEFSSSETIILNMEVIGKYFDSQEMFLSDQVKIEVDLVRTTCGVCERQSSGYYEAVLQVRGEEEISEEKISKVSRALRKKIIEAHSRSREEFVSKVKKKHGGMDLYTSSARLARKLARFLKKEYGADMDESSELVGQTKDGREKYRVTVVSRLPPNS